MYGNVYTTKAIWYCCTEMFSNTVKNNILIAQWY